MASEVELKLVLLTHDTHDIIDHPTLAHYAPEPPVTFDVLNTYFDTPEYDLLNMGVGLRIREVDGQFLQTIKTHGKVVAGLHQRAEYSAELTDAHVDLGKINDTHLQQQLTDLVTHKHLAPIFTTHFSRTKWQLLLNDDNHVEVVLDLGEVRAGEQARAISEVELEMTKGKAHYALYELAADLAQVAPLAIEPHSKAWWGYQLHQAHAEGKTYSAQYDYDVAGPDFFLQQAAELSRRA